MGDYASIHSAFATLFDEDIIGDGPQAAGYADNGIPLRFAHIQYGAKRANVGYRINGVDASNLWAAKGTASYVNGTAGIPAVIEDISLALTAPISASVTLQLRPDGVTRVISATGPMQDYYWATLPAAGIGAGYEVEFTQLTSNGNGSLTGVTLGVFLSMASTRSLSLSSTKSAGQGEEEALRDMRARIKRTSSGAIVATRVFQMRALAQVINEG